MVLVSKRGRFLVGELLYIDEVDPRVSKPLAESLFELIAGENPTRIEHIWQKIYRAHRDIRGGRNLQRRRRQR